MNIQFLVEANQRNIRTLQVFCDWSNFKTYKFIQDTIHSIFILQLLPTFFTERLYPKKGWIYLIHNGGTKHKVYTKMAGGNRLKLYDIEWHKFLDDSKYRHVTTFHFIREEEDSYYVTAYDNSGSELNGYNLDVVGYRQCRWMATLEHLEESPVIRNPY